MKKIVLSCLAVILMAACSSNQATPTGNGKADGKAFAKELLAAFCKTKNLPLAELLKPEKESLPENRGGQAGRLVPGRAHNNVLMAVRKAKETKT